MSLRICIAGASGFGNLGDDAYRLAFERAFMGSLHFDSPYPDIEAVRGADVLVIGGGGLVYCNDTAHFEYMSMYLAEAKRRGIPWIFASIGVQLRGSFDTEEQVIEQAQQIAPWKEWLEGAKIVTVRGHLDRKLIHAVAPEARVEAFPDLVYGLKPSFSRVHLIRGQARIAVPTRHAVRKHIDKFKRLYENAVENELPFYVVQMSRDDGLAVSILEAKLRVKTGLHVLRNLSAQDLLDGVLPHAEIVVSGRYHGHVMARAAGVSQVVSVDERMKSRFEPAWEDPRAGAIAHGALLNRVLFT
jgi:hypothetical protein